MTDSFIRAEKRLRQLGELKHRHVRAKSAEQMLDRFDAFRIVPVFDPAKQPASRDGYGEMWPPAVTEPEIRKGKPGFDEIRLCYINELLAEQRAVKAHAATIGVDVDAKEEAGDAQN